MKKMLVFFSFEREESTKSLNQLFKQNHYY